MNEFKDSITNVMSIMTTQLERIQKSNLEQISQILRLPPQHNMSAIDRKQNDIHPSYMVNFAQGQAHHNTFTHTPPHSKSLSTDNRKIES